MRLLRTPMLVIRWGSPTDATRVTIRYIGPTPAGNAENRRSTFARRPA